ncbi:MAG: TrmB family transcriptional regulator [Gemmatimonadales bacterium]
MPSIDLTPFGFTPTESLVYGSLLQLGPSTGYAVARACRVARANAYGALEGLVRGGAANRVPGGGRPTRYRPTDPQALIAQLAAAQGEALERLSRALKNASQPTEPLTREIAGSRAAANLILQLVARAERRVEGILAADLWRPTLPAWRRAAGRVAVELRVAGDATPLPEEAGVVAGRVPTERPTLLVIDGRQAVAATAQEAELTAIWSSHPLFVAIAEAAVRSLT